MYVVEMRFGFDEPWYYYGRYDDRDRANEIALQVCGERECEVRVREAG